MRDRRKKAGVTKLGDDDDASHARTLVGLAVVAVGACHVEGVRHLVGFRV